MCVTTYTRVIARVNSSIYIVIPSIRSTVLKILYKTVLWLQSHEIGRARN